MPTVSYDRPPAHLDLASMESERLEWMRFATDTLTKFDDRLQYLDDWIAHGECLKAEIRRREQH